MRWTLDLDDHTAPLHLGTCKVRSQLRCLRLFLNNPSPEQRTECGVARHQPIALVDDPHRALENAVNGAVSSNLIRVVIEHQALEQCDCLKTSLGFSGDLSDLVK